MPRSARIASLAFAAFLAATPLAAARAQAPASRPAVRATGLELILTAGQRVHPFGTLPAIGVAWKNSGDGPADVLLPDHGMFFGVQQPLYAWRVKHADGSPVASRPVGRCGNLAALTLADLARLGVGRRVDVDAARLPWSNGPWIEHGLGFPEPGVYRVALTYRVSRVANALKESGDAPADAQEAQRRVDRLTSTDVVSNEVEVRIAEPTPAQAKRIATLKSLREGQSAADVTKALGAPLEKNPSSEGQTIWVYDLIGPDAPNLPRVYISLDARGVVLSVGSPYHAAR